MSRHDDLFAQMFRGWSRVTSFRDAGADTWHVHLEVTHERMASLGSRDAAVDALWPKPAKLAPRTGVRFHGRRVGSR